MVAKWDGGDICQEACFKRRVIMNDEQDPRLEKGGVRWGTVKGSLKMSKMGVQFLLYRLFDGFVVDFFFPSTIFFSNLGQPCSQRPRKNSFFTIALSF